MEQEAAPNNGDEATSLSGNLHRPLCILWQAGRRVIVGSKKVVPRPLSPCDREMACLEDADQGGSRSSSQRGHSKLVVTKSNQDTMLFPPKATAAS